MPNTLYILDTSTLLYSASSFRSFGCNNVVIPYVVLEELDKFKTRGDSVGANARRVARELDELRPLNEGVVITAEGGELRVELNFHEPELQLLVVKQNDDRVLNVCLGLKKAGSEVVLVTQDINLAVRADALGIVAERFDTDRPVDSVADMYTGALSLTVADGLVEDFYAGEKIYPEDLGIKTYPNQYLTLISEQEPGKTALVRCLGPEKLLIGVGNGKKGVWGIRPRNREQQFAVDALLDPTISLVTLTGGAGVGKTLISLACALQSVQEDERYGRLVVSRCMQPTGKDIGYLPGTIEEKVSPWLSPIKDSLEYLMRGKAKGTNTYQDMIDMGMLEVEPLTYIRGRSMPNMIFLLDECVGGNQTVLTKEGVKFRLQTLYKMQKNGKVLPKIKAFDGDTGSFVWADIGKVWSRGEKEVLEIRSANRKFKCTPNHLFLTSSGWKQAKNLSVGDLLVSTEPNTCQLLKSLSSDQRQLFLGSFLGDGNIGFSVYNGVKPSRARLKIIHGPAQEEYLRWKASVFGRQGSVEYIEENGFAKNPAYCFSTLMLGIEEELPSNKSYCPQWVLDELDERGLAIWFMDDGDVSVKVNAGVLNTQSFDEDTHIRMVKTLRDRFGINCTYIKIYKKIRNKHYFQISIRKSGVDVIRNILSKYIHPSMSYKVRKQAEECGGYIWDCDYNVFGYSAVDEITYLNSKTEVYDLEVPRYGTFVISGAHGSGSGVVVHNCQDMTRPEIKTMVSRMGENAKLVLIGDVMQVSNPYLDATNNGLSNVVEKFKDYEFAAHVTLIRGERSIMATVASEIL